MSDQYTIYDITGTSIGTTSGNALTISMNSSGYCYYSSTQIGVIVAEAASVFTLTVSPMGSGYGPEVRYLYGERQGSYPVTGGVTWVYSGDDLVLTFTAPGTVDHAIYWAFTDGTAPPVKLNVKIVRR